MKISPGQNQLAPAEPPATPATQIKNERASPQTAAAATIAKNAPTAGTPVAKPIEPTTDVTLRRDNNGRVYYVLSDANSGQEILEVPPKAIRNVGQGIEDYLKQEQARASTHLKLKA
jgi:hypothetical protein